MPSWVERYLRLLGLSGIEHDRPSVDALGHLCRAQVTMVPFENVTAILRRARTGEGPVPAVDTDAMLNAFEARAGGGVCVDATPTFRRLLLALGYAARPTMAQISFPGSHQASIVTLDRAEYLIDVANGAPFFEPIPIDRETIVARAGLSWRFRRESPDMLVQDRQIADKWKPFCWYGVRPPDTAEVEVAYQRHHLVGTSWVVGNLTVVRSTEREVVRLRDAELVRYSASGAVSEQVAQGDLRRIVDEVFGMPGLPVEDACTVLRTRSPAD
jgi:arylamine N-acetyltransferase